MTDQPAAPIEYVDASGVVPAPAARRPYRPRRWLPVVIGAVTFAVVVVVLGMLVGDAVARNVEMRSLVAKVEVSEAAMGSLQEDVRAIFSQYDDGTQLSDADRAALDDQLTAAAASGREAIAEAGNGVAGLRWLAWHRGIGAAQEAYLAHNRAWQEYLGRAAQDPAEFARPQGDVDSTFEAAERYFRAAQPGIDLFGLQKRIDAIFAPAPAQDGSSQAA